MHILPILPSDLHPSFTPFWDLSPIVYIISPTTWKLGSFFFHPIMVKLVKDLICVLPLVREPPFPWDLNVVLAGLMSPLPIWTPGKLLLIAFIYTNFLLVGIISARRIGEVQALVMRPPYTVYHRNRVSLKLPPMFFPKVVTDFHISQINYLPVFFLKLHTNQREVRLCTFDICRTLFFYLQRTKSPGPPPKLFEAFAGRVNGQAVSVQRLLSEVQVIFWSVRNYQIGSTPAQIRAHSIRARQLLCDTYPSQTPSSSYLGFSPYFHWMLLLCGSIEIWYFWQSCVAIFILVDSEYPPSHLVTACESPRGNTYRQALK